MKNLRYTIVAFILSLPLLISGCMNDDFVVPTSNSLAYKPYYSPAVNTTIKELLDQYSTVINANSLTAIKSGTIIEGTVVSSDANGNFYQQLIIEDGTAGIQVSLAGKGLHIYYPIGQKVVINCDSLFIGGYGKSAELGVDYYNTTKNTHQVGRMTESTWEAHATPVQKASTSNIPAIKEITKYTDIAKTDINTLVTLKNISFDDAQYKTFAPEEEQDGGYAVDRNISFENGSYLVVRTSSYANFAKKVLPGGKGDLTGILGYYNGTYQFVIRDFSTDLGSTFTQYDAVRVPLLSESFGTSLGKMTPVHVTNSTITDVSDWKYTQYGATVSGYESATKKNKAVISYLVSPTIDLTNIGSAFVSFSSAIAFGDTKTVAYMHQLLVSSDYSGNPATATWTVIPFNATVSKYTFINTGKLAVPNEFMGKKVTFALRYKSTTASASTWEVKNLMIDEGAGSSYTLPELPIFSSSLLSTNAGFTAYSVKGDQKWTLGDKSYGFKMSGYYKKNLENEDWAVSSDIDLTGATAPTITFDQAINYANGKEFAPLHTLWITDNFTGDVTTTKWTQITIPTYPAGKNWTFVSSGAAVIPTSFIDKTVRIAFKYESTTSIATTWEIKNLVIK
jgi:hypothetical protein